MAAISLRGITKRYRDHVAVDRLGARGSDVTLQGNLDPALLFAPAAAREAAVHAALEAGLAARAHVFKTVMKINHLPMYRIIIKRITGEIAAQGIALVTAGRHLDATQCIGPAHRLAP